jgi:hypothetical protein
VIVSGPRMNTPFFQITSTGGSTVYVSVSRLLRIQAISLESHVTIFFEGFLVDVETKDGRAEDVANELWTKSNTPGVDLIELGPKTSHVTSISFS